MPERILPPSLQSIIFPLTLEDYQHYAQKTDQNQLTGKANAEFPFLGLFGEAGTLLSALKKRQRDGDAYAHYRDAIQEEVGDVLWYLTNIASRAGLALKDLAQSAAGQEPVVSFVSLQSSHSATEDEVKFENCLLKLAAKIGELFSSLAANNFVLEGKMLESHLSIIFESLVESANAAPVNLEKAAFENLKKTYDLWSPEKVPTPRFDTTFSVIERFPPKLQMDMFDVKGKYRPISHQHINGVSMGKQLSDNKQVQDGYRFHDIFHLAFAVVLGWSPTLRALLRNKRKSSDLIDNSEDGQRAGFLEEGLTALIFQHALSVNCYKGLSRVEYSLLKQIPYFVAEYEVRVCALWEWQKAILQGFAVFNEIEKAGRGSIIADFENRSLTFKPLRGDYPDGNPA